MVRPDESRQVAEVRPSDTWVKRDPPKADTVTLTKSQFNQILQAIGQVNVVNGSDPLFRCQENPSKEDPFSEGPPPQNNEIYEENVPCPLDVVISSPTTLGWSDPPTELSPSKLSPLSKVEQKRLQWQREKAEMIEWNPWGKPGAGAPPKKTQMVAPITPRHNNQLLMVQTSGAMPFSGSLSTGVPSIIPSPSHSRILNNSLDFLPAKNFTTYTCVAPPIKPVPPVFKSSIAFGNADKESVSSDFYKRQQWLHELEYQRGEEQRPLQEPDSAWVCKDDVESVALSVEGPVLPGAADYHKRSSYVRGQGVCFQVDPMAEERRLRAQECQRAVRQQMEEKRRRTREEEERRRREEEEEERRLQEERARLQAEYEEEQERIRRKAELDERKQQVLISAVQQAQAQAEMEKKCRKIQRLIPADQETAPLSLLASNVEQKLKMEDAGTSEPQDTTLNSECSSEPGSKKDLGIQTAPLDKNLPPHDKNSSYVVDRVLTPSIFRVRAKNGGREFGTQTDIHYGKYASEEAESTESNTSSLHGRAGGKRFQRQGERPKWGVNQPSKSYVRMTERDPHFTKRKKMQELRRQHWAREMAAQDAPRTTPSLRIIRKAASSSDCTTLGYSSSEFETKSCHHLRSNSTPRYQHPSGFRSECDSSETVPCLPYGPSALCGHVSKSVFQRRDSHSSDNLPSIIGGSEPSPTHRFQRFHSLSYADGNLPPMRRKWHSQETFHPFHSFSPPHVPGVHPRALGAGYRYDLPHVPQRRKWSDQESFDLESVVRSRVAEESRASSAGSTEKSPSASGSSREKSASSQNPLVCPEVITGRPTPRQDRILQNLSSLRQGLMKKQKELESLIRRPPPYFS